MWGEYANDVPGLARRAYGESICVGAGRATRGPRRGGVAGGNRHHHRHGDAIRRSDDRWVGHRQD